MNPDADNEQSAIRGDSPASEQASLEKGVHGQRYLWPINGTVIEIRVVDGVTSVNGKVVHTEQISDSSNEN